MYIYVYFILITYKCFQTTSETGPNPDTYDHSSQSESGYVTWKLSLFQTDTLCVFNHNNLKYVDLNESLGLGAYLSEKVSVYVYLIKHISVWKLFPANVVLLREKNLLFVGK